MTVIAQLVNPWNIGIWLEIMLASLLRPKKRRIYAERSPFSSPYTTREGPWPFRQEEAQHASPEMRYNETHGAFLDEDYQHADDLREDADQEEEERPIESTPLLPIFSASHLGMVISSCDF